MPSELPYVVMVDDNFHYMDEDERWRLGDFATLWEARQACMDLVEACLFDYYRSGMDAEELYSQYTMFGDDPFILDPGEPGKFSAWNYVKGRAIEICTHTNQ